MAEALHNLLQEYRSKIFRSRTGRAQSGFGKLQSNTRRLPFAREQQINILCWLHALHR